MHDRLVVRRLMNRLAVLAATVLAVSSLPVRAQPVHLQEDWSGGPGVSEPVTSWENRFDSARGIAWRSIPGQLAISSLPADSPTRTVIAGDAGEPASVSAGDLDGDGRDDVIVTDPIYAFPALGAIYWWKSDAAGVWTRHTVDDDFHGAHYAVPADVDLDGDLDVIGAAYYGVLDPPPPNGLPINGRYAWFENVNGDASQWQKHLVGELFNGASHVAAADLDGDGDMDLLGASELTDGIYEQDADIVWFENVDGQGATWTQHDVDDDFPNASEAHPADLDGDGDLDIVGTHQPSFGSSHFHWWENVDGTALTWFRREIPFDFSGSGYVDVGDIDDDGDLDLIGGGLLSNVVGFWQNLDGSGTSWQAWFVTSIPGGRTIQLADVDGDGDLDALVASRNGTNFGAAAWIENRDGTGFSWQLHAMDFLIPSFQPWIAAGDADHDGKLDAFVCHWGEYSGTPTQQLAWWDLTGFDTSVASGLDSSTLDGGSSAAWAFMTWDADVPEDTSLTLEVRASDDPSGLGAFATVPEPGTNLADLIDPQARYLQYRLTLDSADPERSPVVRRIQVGTASGGPQAAGRVPDQLSLPGVPLTLATTGDSHITLAWGESCLTSDSDYAIYAGALGDYYSHEPLLCTTGGQTTETIATPRGDTYYLVVPLNSTREGSYGTDAEGLERTPGESFCLPQEIGTCE